MKHVTVLNGLFEDRLKVEESQKMVWKRFIAEELDSPEKIKPFLLSLGKELRGKDGDVMIQLFCSTPKGEYISCVPDFNPVGLRWELSGNTCPTAYSKDFWIHTVHLKFS